MSNFQPDKENPLDFAQSRIPAVDRESVNINDFIATLTTLRKAAADREDATKEKLFRGKEAVYIYLRENHGGDTLGNALAALQNREIDPSIVGLWIDEGFLLDRLEIEAIEAGYPEHHKLLMERAFLDFDKYAA